MNEGWSNKYLGLSEAEVSCWELARRIYDAELGIPLPSYSGGVVTPEERAEIEATVRGEEAGGSWRQVSGPIRPFDILVFRRGGVRTHIGVAVDGRNMIHVMGDAHVDRITSPLWKSRLTGVYRHLQSPFEGVS
jgi:lipoprotein Spr